MTEPWNLTEPQRRQVRDAQIAAKTAPRTPKHLAVRGLFDTVPIPACGAWSRDLASAPAEVTCGDCKATLDCAMEGTG